MTAAIPEQQGSSSVVERTPAPPLPPSPSAPPTTAPYQPPPPYPPPAARNATPSDGRAIISVAASVLGILLGLPFGLPGLALGTFGYFMGRSAISRIDGAPGTSRGRSLAVTGWVLGIVATAIGAVVSLAWLVLILVSISSPQTFE
jgi:hypothetical protein